MAADLATRNIPVGINAIKLGVFPSDIAFAERLEEL